MKFECQYEGCEFITNNPEKVMGVAAYHFVNNSEFFEPTVNRFEEANFYLCPKHCRTIIQLLKGHLKDEVK